MQLPPLLAALLGTCATFAIALPVSSVHAAPAHAGVHFQTESPAYREGLAAVRRLDYATAIEMWRPLAEQGHGRAQLQLGLLYQRGDGMARNPEESLHWLRKAARQGLALGQFALAERYSGKHGGPALPRKAYYWYAQAAAQGFPTAALRRSELGAVLPGPVRRALDAAVEREPLARRARYAGAASSPPASPGTWRERKPVPARRTPRAAKVVAQVEAPAPPPARESARPAAPGAARAEVQLASLRSERAAEREWKRLEQRHRDLLGERPHRIARVELPGRGTYYRLRVGGLSGDPAARSLCDTLSARRVSCLASSDLPE